MTRLCAAPTLEESLPQVILIKNVSCFHVQAKQELLRLVAKLF